MNSELRVRFASLWTRTVGPTRVDAAWHSLEEGYGSPNRHYHNWRHVEALLGGHDAVRSRTEFAVANADVIDLAIFFHDAIYDPDRQDNEARSAALLLNSAAAASDREGVGRADDMIMATADHGPSKDPATQLLLDLDLAILGAPRPEYDAYVAAIRREYAEIPDDAWRAGRGAVLDRFLARPRLYLTDYFRNKLESTARTNLASEAASLRS
ncbi:Predicted metal-dependent phosphohydrolase, HD superfamily [Faunimonas pinastri]|uniref:Predicted metal-dependent phosphohydrolase, HD superfamily n=1 Tax=Faunimonas pinastri TaxID=1855383 RepID=A0A1H9JPP6_9HYPH|nr:hypothetical protein [Faunimonas pinastri]SEQ88585.1 Predicted metal-dependent phosphohydrolase, HD superfamily [Faunimonas pinastri]